MPTNTELAQQVLDAINAHDVDALRELWADGVEERFPDKTCRGKDELSAYFKQLWAAMPDFDAAADLELALPVGARVAGNDVPDVLDAWLGEIAADVCASAFGQGRAVQAG